MSKIEVFYEDWQYDCCGPRFSVGEYIWWPIKIGNYQKIINNKKRTIKHFCEIHGSGVDRYISGKVNKIEVVGGNEYIKCRDTSEIKEMGYSFLVTLSDVKEIFFHDINELNSFSNPFLSNNKLNKKNIYTKINIIGDLNNTTFKIAKKFKENHYGITFFLENEEVILKVSKKLKTIKSYSNNEYYYINKENYDNLECYLFEDSLNIIVSDKNDYKYFYDYITKIKEEDFFSTFNICYVKVNKDKYEISFDYSKISKNIFHLLKKKNVKYKKTDINYKKIINTEGELIEFLLDKTYKKIRFVNYKKRILFFIILWIIIKMITFIVRY